MLLPEIAPFRDEHGDMRSGAHIYHRKTDTYRQKIAENQGIDKIIVGIYNDGTQQLKVRATFLYWKEVRVSI